MNIQIESNEATSSAYAYSKQDAGRKWLVWLLSVGAFIMALFPGTYWLNLPRQPGIDFFQAWSVAKSQQASAYQLGSPYLHAHLYENQERVLAVASGDTMQLRAAGYHQSQDLHRTSTPLLYYVIGALPSQYAHVLLAYRIALAIAFILGTFILAQPLAANPLSAMVFALVCAASFDPFLFDLRVANVDSIQLLFLVVVLVGLESLRAQLTSGIAVAIGMGMILVLLVLAKPNVAPMAGLLGICLIMNVDRKTACTVATLGAAWAGLLVMLSSLMFRTFAVWGDWWKSLSSSATAGDIQTLGAHLNYSTATAVAGELGMPWAKAALSLASLMLLSAALVVARALRRRDSVASATDIWAALFKDAQACYGIGALALLALSPLVWSHYYVLVLPICFWLMREANAFVRFSGVLTLLLSMDILRRVSMIFPALPSDLISSEHLVAWVPAFFGMLVKLSTCFERGGFGRYRRSNG